MPIRFRCAYCNQLLGIARRKSGQVVRCPTCAGQVVVPQPEEGDDESPLDQPPAAPQPELTARDKAPPVFERSDFEEVFNEPVVQSGAPYEKPAPVSAPAPPPRQAPAAPSPAFDVERVSVPAAPSPAGIVLSPARATILTVVVIVGLALAFAAGLLVGRFFL